MKVDITDGKNHEEEWAKVVEHFGEEVPPQTGIWRQVRERNSARKEYVQITHGDEHIMDCTNTAPQVFGIHVHPPETSVDASVKTAKYERNSAKAGRTFLRGAGNGLGEANRDTGSLMRRRSNGTRSKIDDSEN